MESSSSLLSDVSGSRYDTTGWSGLTSAPRRAGGARRQGGTREKSWGTRRAERTGQARLSRETRARAGSVQRFRICSPVWDTSAICAVARALCSLAVATHSTCRGGARPLGEVWVQHAAQPAARSMHWLCFAAQTGQGGDDYINGDIGDARLELDDGGAGLGGRGAGPGLWRGVRGVRVVRERTGVPVAAGTLACVTDQAQNERNGLEGGAWLPKQGSRAAQPSAGRVAHERKYRRTSACPPWLCARPRASTSHRRTSRTPAPCSSPALRTAAHCHFLGPSATGAVPLRPFAASNHRAYLRSATEPRPMSRPSLSRTSRYSPRGRRKIGKRFMRRGPELLDCLRRRSGIPSFVSYAERPRFFMADLQVDGDKIKS